MVDFHKSDPCEYNFATFSYFYVMTVQQSAGIQIGALTADKYIQEKTSRTAGNKIIKIINAEI